MSSWTKKSFAMRAVLFLAFFLGTFAITASSEAGSDRQVKTGDKIKIHYTGKLQDDKVFDSSEGRDPFQFTVGSKDIIDGLSDGVVGMKIGEKKTIQISPDKAYGKYDERLTTKVPLKYLPKDVKPGAMLVNPKGNRVVVKEIKGDTAVMDGNHPLAGKTLIFMVELVSIQ